MQNRSDTSENTVESHKNTVRAFLQTHGEVVSKEALHAGTGVVSAMFELSESLIASNGGKSSERSGEAFVGRPTRRSAQ